MRSSEHGGRYAGGAQASAGREAGEGPSTSAHGDGAGVKGIPDEAAMHPSSWPPASQRNLMPTVRLCPS